jgi:hypothetical protein
MVSSCERCEAAETESQKNKKGPGQGGVTVVLDAHDAASAEAPSAHRPLPWNE